MREPLPFEDAALQTRPAATQSIFSFCREMGRLWWRMKQPKQALIFSIISILAVAVSTLMLGRALRDLIDEQFFLQDTQQRLWALGSFMGIIVFFSLSSFGRSYFVADLGERFACDLRQRIFNHVLKLDVGFFENLRVGEIIARLGIDVELIQNSLGSSMAIALRNFLLFMGGGAMMLSISPKLTFYTLAIVPFVIIPIILFGRMVQRFSKRAQDEHAHLSGYMDETLHNIRTVQAFTHEKMDIHIFKKFAWQNYASARKRNLAKSTLSTFVMISVSAGIVLMLSWGAASLMHNELTTGMISAFVIYACVVGGSVGSFSEIAADLRRAAGAQERLFEILNAKPALHQAHPHRALSQPVRGIVAIHNVSFSYPTHTARMALHKVTFSIAPGENVAIVGPSGAGKSTIFSLLLRYFDPQSGAIYFDGVDLRDLDVHELRQHLGVVGQDIALFSTTILENIIYGCPNATSADISRAVTLSGVEMFLPEMPNGIKTHVGSHGVRLSGGQKQRVAIARAILRDPRFLLLDEATNALDAQSEEAVQTALRQLSSSRTTLVIAHRLSTVLRCDKIIVLDQGEIQDMGTHAELIDRNPLYQRLSTLQFPDARMNVRRAV